MKKREQQKRREKDFRMVRMKKGPRRGTEKDDKLRKLENVVVIEVLLKNAKSRLWDFFYCHAYPFSMSRMHTAL